jgi:tetratricopeptide (TPR) repeat protein
MAKLWFAEGETRGRAGDDVGALKAYQCSLTFVAHGFTAYNVGQIAEKTGDLELAISSFEQYLLLVPDANDAVQVRERIDQLRARLEKVRETERAQAEARAKPQPTGEPIPVQPKVAPRKVASHPEGDVYEEPEGSPLTKRKLAGYITAGSGGVLVLGGLLSNLLARSQMSTCRSEYENNNRPAAESACNNAKPLAYLSYGLFGAGGAAVLTGAYLILVHPIEGVVIAANPLPEGGLTLRWSGRF